MKALLALLIAFFVVSGGRPALAFEPQNQRLYPNPQYRSYVVDQIKATRLATYRAVDNYGWAGWPLLVSQALDTGSVYQNSLGNVLSAAVPSFSIREARFDEAPTMLQVAESAAAQQTHCNDPEGWSVACAYLLNPLPAPTYYKAGTMQLYGFTGQAAVIQHETFHLVARACDQYPGGCPLLNGIWPSTVQCTGNPDSLMDCGLAARFAQPFDVDTFLLATGFQRQTPEPCGIGGPDQFGNRWDSCGEWWLLANGGHFKPNSGCGEFYLPDGRLEWGNCDSWGGGARWQNIAKLWLSRSGLGWNPAAGAGFDLHTSIPIP